MVSSPLLWPSGKAFLADQPLSFQGLSHIQGFNALLNWDFNQKFPLFPPLKGWRLSACLSPSSSSGNTGLGSSRYSSPATPVPIFALIFNCAFWQEPCLSWLESAVMSHQGDRICWLLKQVITFFFFYDSFSSKSLIYDESRLDVSIETVSNGLSYYARAHSVCFTSWGEQCEPVCLLARAPAGEVKVRTATSQSGQLLSRDRGL